jgi:hypothetical protein
VQHKHRGYGISISIQRYDDSIKIDTEIFLPTAVDAQDRDRTLTGDTEVVAFLALEDIHKEALESAKRTVDVLIAERSPWSKAP